MAKLEQLYLFDQLGIPTPTFLEVSYQESLDPQEIAHLKRVLRAPYVVRSNYSYARAAKEEVEKPFYESLYANSATIEIEMHKVFERYPTVIDQNVIVQERIAADYQGTLLAFRNGIWKLDCQDFQTQDLSEARTNPYPPLPEAARLVLLPKFAKSDVWISTLLPSFFPYWKPFKGANKTLTHNFVRLSNYAKRLLKHTPAHLHGLKIRFLFAGRKVYFLTAEPISTPLQSEEVLIVGEHQELFSAAPTRMMVSLMQACGKNVFNYYRKIDSTLERRNFFEVAEGLPCINYSALLDVMVHWGLPTRWIAQVFDAPDLYRVGFRPFRFLYKFPAVWRGLQKQLFVVPETKRWLKKVQQSLSIQQEKRLLIWQKKPAAALDGFFKDLKMLYTYWLWHIHTISAALALARRIFGTPPALKSLDLHKDLDFYQDFFLWRKGKMQLSDFLEKYGHRGFYESDFGSLRFSEKPPQYWERWKEIATPAQQKQSLKSKLSWIDRLWLLPFLPLLNLREQLRNAIMTFFFSLKKELQQQAQIRFGQDFDFASYHIEDLKALFQDHLNKEEICQICYPQQGSWLPQPFLHSKEHQITQFPQLQKNDSQVRNLHSAVGLSIQEGKVRGRVWRVNKVESEFLDFKSTGERTILVADALDPSWIPCLAQIDGIVLYIGNYFSQTAILLRELKIPAISKIEPSFQLYSGDLIEMDAHTGKVTLLERSANAPSLAE
ncbi:PEP-utilizing enzyme [Hugenholtzia roseola]|uniref:PEP-utilizing enzyme n=1 Tax=Hugenholtzia roseola TaxID=1002 RepID=UPI0004138718|nr:PEP-utilizing enzyme [Hugenholtzia roseola]